MIPDMKLPPPTARRPSSLRLMKGLALVNSMIRKKVSEMTEITVRSRISGEPNHSRRCPSSSTTVAAPRPSAMVTTPHQSPPISSDRRIFSRSSP